MVLVMLLLLELVVYILFLLMIQKSHFSGKNHFKDWVSTHLLSLQNPNGTITNSDLELAGSIVQNNISPQAADVHKKTTHNSYYNNI